MTTQRRCSSFKPPRQRRKSWPSDGSLPTERRSTTEATSSSLNDSAAAGLCERRLKTTLRASASIQPMASPLVRSNRGDFSQIRNITSCRASWAASWSLNNRLQRLNNFGPTAWYRFRNATRSPSATRSSVVASSPFDTCSPSPGRKLTAPGIRASEVRINLEKFQRNARFCITKIICRPLKQFGSEPCICRHSSLPGDGEQA